MKPSVSFQALRIYLVIVFTIFSAAMTCAAGPVITSEPANITVPAGGTATFTVSATGTAPLTYHWRFGGSAISGASSVLTLPNVADSQAGSYTVVVSDVSGSTTSAPPAILTITHPPVITSQPQSQLLFSGEEAFFSVTVNGATPFSYQWKKDGIDLAGETAGTLDLMPVLDSDAGSYTVAISNMDGTINSAAAILSIVEPGLVTSQLINAPVNTCSTLAFSVKTFSPVALHYQWQFNGNPVGSDATNYSIANISLADAGKYRVVVTDPFGGQVIPAVALAVRDPLPTITGCPANVTVGTGPGNNSCSQAVNWTPPSVSDNCPGVTMTQDHNSGDVFPVGSTLVTYIATDSAGQHSTCSFTVTVLDDTPPTVVTKDISVQLDPSGHVSIAAADVDNLSTDACGIASMSVSPNSFTCADVGPKSVLLTVTDIHGNSASHTATVTVQDLTPPVVVTKNITVNLDGSGHVSITGADVDNGSSDACGIASLAVSPNSFTCGNVGANSVTLTVTDIHGNVASHPATVTVQDLTAPTVITKNITVSLDATGHATIAAADVDNGSTDACGISTKTVSPNSFTCANIGANTVTLTITDIHGNTASQTATVTVQDTTAPAVVFNTIAVQLDAAGNYSLTTADVDAIAHGSSDSCGISSKGVTPGSFNFCDVGTKTVTLTVTDLHGNVATASGTISVLSPVAQPGTVYIDATYGTSCGAVTFPNAGGTGTYYIGYNAFSTIQGGINAAATNGTVTVAPGIYDGLVTIDHPVTLLSLGGLATTTIKDSSASGLGAVLVTGATVGVQIGDLNQGFTILGNDGTPGIENSAIYVRGTHSGLKVIGNNVVAGGDEAFLTEFSAVISGLVVSDNEFSGKTFVGPNPAGLGSSQQFTLTNVPRQLVVISGPTHTNVTFTRNLVSGTAGGTNTDNQAQGNYLVTIDAGTSTITDNTFSGISTRFAAGLRVRGPNAIVTGNLFAGGTPIGIDIDKAPAAATAHINFNSFAVGYGLAVLNETASLLDAQNNWWGSLSGPFSSTSNSYGTGSGVQGLVTFSPWLGDGTDTSAVTGFQPNSSPTYAPPTHLAFSTQPAGANLGSPLASQPVVVVLDGNNNVTPWANPQVTMSVGNNPGSGVLTGTNPQTAAGGVAAFTDLAITVGGGAGYTLAALAPSLTAATSSPFDIANPAPTATSLSPFFARAGSGAFALTVNGGNFVPNSVVYWNGAPRTTTYHSPSQVTAGITAADISSVGTAAITLATPGPGGGATTALSFEIKVAVPSVVYVDAGYVGLPADTQVSWPYAGAGSHIIGYDAFATVQSAVNAVAVAGTVNVAAGSYFENITLAKPVHLLGSGGNTIIYPAFSDIGVNPNSGPSFRGSQIVVVVANDVEIANLTVNGDSPLNGPGIDARNGIIEGDPGPYSGLDIHDCTVTNIYLRGIYARSAAAINGFHIHDNRVGNVQGGPLSIAIFNFGGSGVFSNNVVSDSSDAISANWSMGTKFQNNTIIHSASGIHTDNNGGSGGDADLIDGNVVRDGTDGAYGIWVFAPYRAVTVSGNTVTNVDVGLAAAGQSAPVVTLFTNNTVLGNFAPKGAGVYVTSSLFGFGSTDVAASFGGNFIQNHATGFFLESTNGFSLNVTAFDNSISGNVTGVQTNDQGGHFIMNASGNWWGVNTPAGVAALVPAGVVDFTPWLDSGTDVSADPGFQGSFHVLHVSAGSPQFDPVGRIQEGVNLVSGSTVLIGAGAYSENISISANTSLVGAGSGTTAADTIITAADPSLPTIAINDGCGAGTSDRLIIQNLRVTGSTAAGLQINSSSGLHSYFHFENVASVSNAGNGIALAGIGSISQVEVANCILDNNGNTGFRIASSLAAFNTLNMSGGEVEHNANFGVSVNPSGAISEAITGINITGTTFISNGNPATRSSGDIRLFGFNGDASIQNVSIAATGYQPFQLTGKGSGSSSAGWQPSGTVQLSNITLSGSPVHQAFYISRYSDISGITLSGIDLTGYVPPMAGPGFEVPMVLEVSSAAPLNLADTRFPQVPAGHFDLAIWNVGGATATCSTVFVGSHTPQAKEAVVNDSHLTAGKGTVTFPIFDITCPAPILMEATNHAGNVVAYSVTATDACDGSPVVTSTPSSGSVFPVGVTTVNSLAVDSLGNSNACSFTVTVRDTTAPTLNCPTNVTVNRLQPTDPYFTGGSTGSDAGDDFTITYRDDRSGLTNCNATGDIVRTWTAFDVSHNTNVCTQIITVVDNIPPVFKVFPANITITNDLGQCSAVVNFKATAVDVGYAEGFEDTSYISGNYQVQPSVSWNDSNSHVTRVPNGTGGINSSSGAGYGLIDSTVSAAAGDSTGAFSRLGGYGRVFGNGFRVATDIYINLNDPAVTSATPFTGYGLDLSAAASKQDGGYLRDFIFHAAAYGPSGVVIGADNNSSDSALSRRNDLLTLTNHAVLTNSGWYTFEWIFRNAGNVLAVDLNVRDTGGNLLFSETRSDSSDLINTIVGGNRYLWFTFLAVDKLPIDNTILERNVAVVPSIPSGSSLAVGVTNVTCTITDACGNSTNQSFIVTVNDVEPPVIIPPADIIQSNDPGQCGAVVTFAVTNVTDNCGVSSVVATPASGSVFTVGTTPVVIVATDIHGNSATNGFTVTINDTQPPVISGLPAGITTQTGPGRTTCDQVVSWPAPTVTDNCGVSTVVSTPASGSLFPVGTTLVVTVATDVHGNTSTQLFNVVVVDNTPPVITGAPADFTVMTGPGRATCDQVVSWPAPTVTDNCSVSTVVATPPSGSTFPVGVTPVTIVATDVHGNTSSVSFSVTVLDNTPPVLVTKPAAVTLDASGQGVITAADVYNAGASTDNCGPVTLISVTPVNFTFCNLGANVVTLVAQDSHGNFATNTATVTVNLPSAPPAAVYVDASYGTVCGPVTFPNVGGAGVYYVGYNAFASIQAGADAVAANGTVNVAAGNYVEENLTITQPLTLSGPNANIDPNTGTRAPEAIILPATSDPDPSSPTSVNVIYVTSSHVTIKGLTVDGSNPGLAGGVLVGGTAVNACEGIASYEGVGSIVLAKNIIKNTAYSGLDFYNYNNGGGVTSDNHINQNHFDNIGYPPYGFGFAVLVYNNFYADVSSNVMTRVRLGVQTGNFFSANTGPAARISDNTMATSRRGIYHNLHYSGASPFTISNNVISVVDEAGGVHWDGIVISSIQSSVGVDVVNNVISATPVTQSTYGYQVWNNPTTLGVAIKGGSVTGANLGVWLKNYDNNYGAGESTRLTLSGLEISGASQAGLYVQDDIRCTNGSILHATVTDNTVISNCAVGVLVQGTNAGATVINNSASITGNAVGVQVDTGVALLENNDLRGNTLAAISVLNGARVDAGDCSGGNFSGLGTGSGLHGSSIGHNDLTGYGFDNATPWAITNANTSVQGVVYAQNNNFGANPDINALIFDGSDNSGASSLVIFSQSGSVLVTPPGPVTVQCPGDVPAGATSLAQFAAQGGTVSATIATVAFVDSPLSPGPHEGTITRTYTVNDACGDSGVFTQTITVADTIPPVIASTPNIVIPNDAGVCGAVVSFPMPATSDNCGVASVIATPASGTIFAVGTTPVTILVTDFHGNTSATTFNVTVNDTELPSISTPPNIVQANDHGSCGAVVVFPLPVSHDNCGVAGVVTSPVSGSTFPVGVTTVQITATDIHGNSAHSSFTVTVNDTELPVIACPADIVQINDPNQTGAVVNFPLPSATDNCQVAGVVTSPASGSTFPVGVTTVTVTATDIHGNVSHCTFTVTINDLPVITSQPVSLTNNASTTAVFTVTATGTQPLHYQWVKNGTNNLSDFGNISGSSSNVLTLANVLAADAGSYSVVISNVAGTLASSNALLTVIDPAILTQPTNLTVVNGNPASFTVVAAGTAPLTYQWKQNGSAIVGATAATLALNAVSDTDAGAYTVVVTTPAGTASSTAANLTVLDPPVVVSQPLSISVNLGQSATFAVSANGRTPFSYQWKKNGVNITGATARLFTIAHVADTDAASYSVFISNVDGNTTSAAATLTVIDPPVISTQPVGVTNNAGTTVTFSVSASGTTPIAYQWVKNGTNNLVNGGNISGSQSNVLTLVNVLGGDAGSYTVVLSNPAATVTSAAATLKVIDPILTSQPVSVTANRGSIASFTVGAFGSSPLSFQWFQETTAVPGATSATLAFSSVTDSQAGNYHVLVTNAFGSTNSIIVSLTVIAPPFITSQPVSRTNVAGTTATFSVTATGTAPAYQWYKGVTLIAGATSPTLTLPNVSSADVASYTVVLSNAAGTVTSSPATLTVNNPLQITTQPVSRTNVAGTTATFTVAVSGTTPYTYKWFKNATNALADGGNISGANSNVLTLTNVLAADAASYTVVVSNVVGSLTSASASLVVIDPAIISQSPTNVSVIDGNSFSLTVTAAGTTALNYQWFVDGDPLIDGFGITGSSTATLTVSNATDSDAGTYTVIVSNSIGSVTSAPIVLITHVPLITTQPAGLTVNVGQPAGFSVSANGTLPFTYQWLFNGVNISGATSRIFALSHVVDADAGSYTVLVGNPDGTELSHPAALTIVDPPVISTQPTNVSSFVGATAAFTVVASGPVPLSYQWQKNGVNLTNGGSVAGSTSPTLTLANLTLGDAAAYRVIVSNSGGAVTGTVTSSAANLAVYPTAAATLHGPVVSGGQATLTLTGVPGFAYVIQGSADLGTWTPLRTNTAPFTFVDTDAASFTHRFYRAVYVP